MSNTAGQSDPTATDDSSASVPAQTSAEAPPTTTADSVSSASDTLPTSEPVDSQSSAEVTSEPPTTQQSSAVESSQPSETQVSSAATSSVDAETTSSEPSQVVTSSQPSATKTKKSSSDNNDSSSSDDEPTSTAEPTSDAPKSTVVVVTKSSGQSSVVVVVTSTTIDDATGTDAAASASSTSDSPALGGSGNSDKGLSQGSKVAIGVVVPIAAIAILALVGLFWWRKRRSRKQAQEERRKEVEDYAYNPNADPTVPSVMGDGYEMREDTSSAGYRGWGNTTNSTGRKASTTMSGGQTGQAYSDVTSPIRGNASDGRSNDPLMDGSYSPEGEILGAMGPNAANNRGADVHRGPSNASSSYSAARSDGSDPAGPPYGSGAYYDQYAQNNPFGDSYNGQPPAAPVIRDNPARRNTRIENPSHYPQQSAGISQNF